MNQPSSHTIKVYQDIGGQVRISVDAPGVAAVSAPIMDAIALIRDIAFDADLEFVEDEDGTKITISVPPGA